MQSNLIVRPLTVGDRKQWDPLWQGYLTFYKEKLPAGVTDVAFARLAVTGPHRGMVAEREGKLIGLVHYLFHDRTWSVGPTCYLEDLFVDPTERGHGVGRALIEAVYAAADAAGSHHVYWQTQSINTTARTLYDKVAKLSEFVRYDRPEKT